MVKDWTGSLVFKKKKWAEKWAAHNHNQKTMLQPSVVACSCGLAPLCFDGLHLLPSVLAITATHCGRSNKKCVLSDFPNLEHFYRVNDLISFLKGYFFIPAFKTDFEFLKLVNFLAQKLESRPVCRQEGIKRGKHLASQENAAKIWHLNNDHFESCFLHSRLISCRLCECNNASCMDPELSC